MAEKDEYIREAYEDLKKLSLDEQKRLGVRSETESDPGS